MDKAHWSAVEEVIELFHEEHFYQAMRQLHSILKVDPHNPYAYYFLGIAFYEVGELEASRDAYMACLRVSPTHLGARVALCHVLRSLGEWRSAIREGMEAFAQAPGDSDVLYALGLAYFGHGDGAAAQKYLRAFLETYPELEVKLEVEVILKAMEESQVE
ncbi:hypothetical protein BCY86_01555 [Pajaroellobacter abortibovis]|uniref:Uncharacterized protein n=1 Tax=Pajaroellobacter abortibovis TaxID=1882918 RepID=A0A1L6MZ11_9BACT|nr:hypothetical protein BCY86_01555 [Pajaroellobacter abortibovis]